MKREKGKEERKKRRKKGDGDANIKKERKWGPLRQQLRQKRGQD